MKARICVFFFFQAEDGIRDGHVTGVQTCALPISANAHVAAASTGFAFANDTHYPLQLEDVLLEPVEIAEGQIAISQAPGLGLALDVASMATLAALELRESPFYDDIQGDAPSVGQIL